jgi:hypothetical protein
LAVLTNHDAPVGEDVPRLVSRIDGLVMAKIDDPVLSKNITVGAISEPGKTRTFAIQHWAGPTGPDTPPQRIRGRDVLNRIVGQWPS